MSIPVELDARDFELSFKLFHRLMADKVREILLVSSPYDAFIMEEDGRLAERIINEYRGLNLSSPPMLTWVSNSREALEEISKKRYDLVLSMPRMDDIEPLEFGHEIKKIRSDLPFFLLVRNTSHLLLDPKYSDRSVVDKMYVWSGNTDLLLAIVKNVEDRWNIDHDTRMAWVRVIVVVEDSPRYLSSILPLLYRQIVMQTQGVIEDSINAEHRMLRMRARPKIVLAENYEEAENFYEAYKPYVLTIFSDVRYPMGGKLDERAGVKFLSKIHEGDPDLPLLLLSSEESNRRFAEKIPAVFLNKNSPSLHDEIGDFFLERLGFGDFIFRTPEGEEIARASNLRTMETILPEIPVDSIYYHATRNQFSSWLMARSEIKLASMLKTIKAEDFEKPEDIKTFLIKCITERRRGRQKGMITDFGGDFDPSLDFVKMGRGSLGGKARGLAFLLTLLKREIRLQKKYPDIVVRVPKAVVITTDAFDDLVRENDLKHLATEDVEDEKVVEGFLSARLPAWVRKNLRQFVEKARYPLAVRSSSLLEDAQHEPFAGIYRTYMLPNVDPDPKVRYRRLAEAVKMVYASIYLHAPKAYAQTTMHRLEEEKMAVILQELTGKQYGDYYFPAVSGVALSRNFYPIAHLRPEDGLAHLAMGLGKTVVEGETALRFSPPYPQFLPQFSTVDDILENSQRFIYALKMADFPDNLAANDGTLAKLEIDELENFPVFRLLAGTYVPDEHRIRDSSAVSGYPVLTFAGILKHGLLPLPELLTDVLEMGKQGMGSPVEIEFAMNIPEDGREKSELALLQIRPMASCRQALDVEITEEDRKKAFCYSTMALGFGKCVGICDIVFVKPDEFDPARTVDAAAEIGKLNGLLLRENRKYLLVGPGRWGSADRWLGIPVKWNDISGVGAMVEASTPKLKADPSQGSHFFHNITSLGIGYLTVRDQGEDFFDWDWLLSFPAENETRYLKHVRLPNAIDIKIDGRTSRAAILKERGLEVRLDPGSSLSCPIK